MTTLSTAANLVCGILIALHLLIVIWVVRDARQRGSLWYVWMIVSLVPVLGLIVYLIMRPSLFEMDRAEQELDVMLKQRQLMKFGECSRCSYPIESDYVVCPQCYVRLQNICIRCHRPLQLDWKVCPYCGIAQKERTRPAEGENPVQAQSETEGSLD